MPRLPHRKPIGPKERAEVIKEEGFDLKPLHDDRAFQDSITQKSSFLFLPKESGIAKIPDIRIPKYLETPCCNQPTQKWIQAWSYIHSAFFDEAENLRREIARDPHRLKPESDIDWWRTVKNCILKSLASGQGWNLPDNYLLHQDIGAWAYVCTISEFCFRNPRFDEDRFLRSNIPWRACRVLVTRFYDFVLSRRNYHAQILQQLSHGVLKESKVDSRIRGMKELKGRSVAGRPKGHDWKMQDEHDLWLLLIWPIVLRYRWTYLDVLRAERLFFAEKLDAFAPPSSAHLEAIAQRKGRQCFASGLLDDEMDWFESQLNVTAADKNRIIKRCRAMELQLPPRSKNGPRQRMPKEPKMLMLLFHFPTRTSFGRYHPWA